MAELHLSRAQKRFVFSDSVFKVALCGIASGKTYAAAAKAVLDLTQNRSTIVTAQTYSALELTVFPAICSVLDDVGLHYCYNRSVPEISLYKTNGYYPRIVGKSAEKIENVRGLTRFSSLVMDEGALYKDGLYQLMVLLGRLRGESEKKSVLITTTPRGDANWVSHFIRRDDVEVLTATMFDNPYIDDEYRRLVCSSYEVGSPLYEQEVLGRIVGSDQTNAIVKLSDFVTVRSGSGGAYVMGIDFARDGVDTTQMYLRDDFGILDHRELRNAHTQEILTEFAKVEEKWGRDNIRAVFCDGTGGYSSGFADTARLTHSNIFEVNFGACDIADPAFANNKATIFDRCARAVKEGFLVDDDRCKEELRAHSWFVNNSGRRQLVPKSTVKTILGRSPDRADALALTFSDYGSLAVAHDRNWYAEKSSRLASLL